MENEQLIIDRRLAQGIVTYLETKPYAEVYQLIAALMQLKPVEQKAEVSNNGIPKVERAQTTKGE